MKTSERMFEALKIFEKYDANLYFYAEHDVLGVHLTAEEIPEDSEDGKALDKLGWSIGEFDTWSLYV